MGFFTKKKAPKFTIGNAQKDVASETVDYIKAIMQSYNSTFGNSYTQEERTQYALTALTLLHGRTPHTHREITKADEKKIKKVLTAI